MDPKADNLNSLKEYATISIALTIVVGLFVARSIASRIKQYRALKDLPGPPASSLLTGNLGKFFDPDSVAWHAELTEKYGSAVRLTGPFGVSTSW